MNNYSILVLHDSSYPIDGKFGGNTIYFDTTTFMQEKKEFTTTCNRGDCITWRVDSTEANTPINIISFNGELINSNICKPTIIGAYASAIIDDNATKGTYTYNMEAEIYGFKKSYFLTLIINE